MANLPLSGLSDINSRIEEYRARTGMSPTGDMVRSWSQPMMAQEAQRQLRDEQFANRLSDIQKETSLSTQRLGLEEERMKLEKEQRDKALAAQNTQGLANTVMGAGKLGLSLYSLMGSPAASTPAVTSASGGTTAGGITLGVPASSAPTLTGLSSLSASAAAPAVAEAATPALASTFGTTASVAGANAALASGAGAGVGAGTGAVTGAEAGTTIGPWGTVIGAVIGLGLGALLSRRG